jgi:hypothetical protein
MVVSSQYVEFCKTVPNIIEIFQRLLRNEIAFTKFCVVEAKIISF